MVTNEKVGTKFCYGKFSTAATEILLFSISTQVKTAVNSLQLAVKMIPRVGRQSTQCFEAQQWTVRMRKNIYGCWVSQFLTLHQKVPSVQSMLVMTQCSNNNNYWNQTHSPLDAFSSTLQLTSHASCLLFFSVLSRWSGQDHTPGWCHHDGAPGSHVNSAHATV